MHAAKAKPPSTSRRNAKATADRFAASLTSPRHRHADPTRFISGSARDRAPGHCWIRRSARARRYRLPVTRRACDGDIRSGRPSVRRAARPADRSPEPGGGGTGEERASRMHACMHGMGQGPWRAHVCKVWVSGGLRTHTGPATP